MSSPTLDTPRGRPVGKFILVAALGQGGMGEVWKAWDTHLSRWVALKFLKSVGVDDLERFRREAMLAASLSHPGIGAIYEVGDDGGLPFIVMQFIEGRTLRGLRGDAREAARIARDAAQALEFAHARGIVHRDLKPDNLMLDGAGRLFVMDFGLARPAETGTGASLTGTGMAVGTPAYMPPEQARGEKSTRSSDVWGLGATLYELLGGRAPFGGATVFDILTSVVTDDPAPPPGAPPELEAVVMRCLEKEPSRRYAGMKELREDLDAFLAGEAVSARRIGALGYFWRRLRRRPALISATAAVLLLGIAFAAYAMTTASRHAADKERLRQAGEARRESDAAIQRAAADLQTLRLRSYRPDWHLTELEFREFEAVEGRVREQMGRSGLTAYGWSLIGRIRQVLADEPGAVDAYDRALAIDANHAGALAGKGQVLLAQAMFERFSMSGAQEAGGPWDRMVEEATALLERATPGDDVDLDLARAWAKAMRKDAAAPFCDAMIAKHAKRDFVEEFLLPRGIATGRLREDATEVIDRRKSFADAYVWRALAKGSHEARDALNDLDRAVALHPRNVQALVGRAGANYKLGRLNEALADCERTLALRPGHPWALSLRGATRDGLGDTAGALADYDAVLAARPGWRQALSGRAMVKANAGDPEGAAVDAEAALASDGRDVTALRVLGLVLENRGDWQGALARYDDAVKAGPASLDARTGRARARARLLDLRGAVEDYDFVLAQGPSAVAHTGRGSARLGLGDIRGALEDLDKGIVLDPRADAYTARAQARRLALQYDGALGDAAEALKLAPDHLGALAERGKARVLKGQDRDGMADLAEVVRRKPKSEEIYHFLGEYWANGRDGEKALKCYDEALAIKPDFVQVLINRGLVLFHLGRGEEGIRSMEKGLALAPKDWRHRAEVEAVLRKMKE